MPLTTPWSKVVCSFCFHRFHIADAHIRKIGSNVAQENDTAVEQHFNVVNIYLNKTEVPNANILDRFYVSRNIPNDQRKICPKCHMRLPHRTATGELKSKIFAIVGPRSSGKSNYFGVLLEMLSRKYGVEAGFTMMSQETFSFNAMKDVSSNELYKQRYREKLFKENMVIEQTLRADANIDLRMPLIYRLEFDHDWKQKIVNFFIPHQCLDLIIFDTAGEDLEDPQQLENFYQYLTQAAGIVFLIDPFQIPGLRQLLPTDLQQQVPDIGVDAGDIIDQVIRMFETKIKLGKKIKTPVAFALSKSDILKPLLDRASSILQDSFHEQGFNEENFTLLDNEIKGYLEKWGASYLLKKAEKFQRAGFFAISALGEMPDANMKINALSPIRIADPLLWLLWELKYIKTMQQ